MQIITKNDFRPCDLMDLVDCPLFGLTHMPHLKVTLQALAESLLQWRAGSLRSFAAIRKEAGIFSGSFLWKGEVLAYNGRIQNLKDSKDLPKPERHESII